jgi:hypothetical protein
VFYAAPRLARYSFLSPLFYLILAALWGGAAAEEEQNAVSALDMDSSLDTFDASRFELLEGLNNVDCVAIASAYGWNGGRLELDDSGEWKSARLGEGAGGCSGSSSNNSSKDGGWYSFLSAAPIASSLV